MPSTIARTPRPSANAAPMMKTPRTAPAASGLRPIALAAAAAKGRPNDAEGRDARLKLIHLLTSYCDRRSEASARSVLLLLSYG